MEGSQNEPFYELLHPRSSAPASPPTNAAPPLDSSSALESISPSYDFQLTRVPKPAENAHGTEDPIHLLKGTSLASSSSNSHHHTLGPLNNEKPRAHDPVKAKEDQDLSDQSIIATIEVTMKNHTDKLLYSLEGVSARLSHLESTVQGLEHSLHRLKLAEDENQSESNHKLVKLEHLLGEVHARLQIVQERQQVLDQTKSQLQLQHTQDKITSGTGHAQGPDSWQQNKEEVHTHVTSSEPAQHRYPPQAPTPYQHQPPPQPSLPPPPQQQQQQSFSAQNVPPQQPLPPPPPPPQQQSFIPQNAPPPSVNEPKPAVQQPYSAPQKPPQPYQQPPPAPPFHYQQAPPQLQPQPQPQGSYNPSGEVPSAYGHMQQPRPVPPSSAIGAGSSYIPELPQYPAGAYHPPQQHVLPNVSQPMYDGRVGPPQGVNVPPPAYVQVAPQQVAPQQQVSSIYEASSGGYGTPPYRAGQPVPSAPSGGYPRLPTAQPIVHSVSSASNRSPVDEIMEKVAAMGFSREQARGVVRQLTENGQPVELNVVLDKLMNGSRDSGQPQRGWFGRG